jgi:D-alanyl-D-alanine carboxypeptidase/D-alanyl-D-alanine-endopeptidase (penicillin-binding protein 4)
MNRKTLSILSALSLAACAGTPVTPPVTPVRLTPREALVREVDSLIAQPQFRTAQWGILVVDPATGDTLVSRNAGKLFIPASNEKIITSAVALTQLGGGYSYRTTFATRGTRTDSVLDGDLIVIGRGDPSLSDAMRGNAMAAMDSIADSVAARGIRRITGSLVSGGNAFPDSTLGFGWEWDDLGGYYAAGVDELFINEGMPPDRLRAGGGVDSLFSGPGMDPDRVYLAALDTALAHRGILVAQGVAPRSLDPLPAIDTLFVLQSPPLTKILPALLKPSQNQIAEILFKTVGLERGGAGTADSARKVVMRQLLDWGARPDGYVIHDGSGMSRHDLVTPETIVRVLDVMQHDTAFASYYAAMPIAGIDGTIKNRMKGTLAVNNVHAKTGSVDMARSLSGYVTTADGERLIFSILCNNYTTPSSSVTGLADVIAASLASYRRQP